MSYTWHKPSDKILRYLESRFGPLQYRPNICHNSNTTQWTGQPGYIGHSGDQWVYIVKWNNCGTDNGITEAWIVSIDDCMDMQVEAIGLTASGIVMQHDWDRVLLSGIGFFDNAPGAAWERITSV